MMSSPAELRELLERLERVRAGELLVIQTSGSTDQPKRVALRWSALVAAAQSSQARIGAANWLLAVPTQYIAGVMVAVRAVVAGTEVRSLNGTSFAEALLKLPEPRCVSLVPNQLDRLLDDAPSRAALASCAAVLIGGQRLPDAMRERAEAAGIRVIATYGSSETAGGCVWDGRPLDGVELRVDEGERLWISGPMLAEGYLTEAGELDAERTRASFVEQDGRRWVRTDDRAALSTDAHGPLLEVLGRLDSVLISGGLKLDVAEVQRALDSGLAGGPALALTLPGTRWGESLGVVLLESSGIGHRNHDRLSAALVERFGPAAKPIIVASSDLVLDTGKPDLRALRAVVRERAAALGLLASMGDDGSVR